MADFDLDGMDDFQRKPRQMQENAGPITLTLRL